MKGFKSFFESNKITYDYSCVMYELPKKMTNLILEWSKKNISEECLYTKYKQAEGRVRNIHVTVLYGLHTNNFEKVQKIINFFDYTKIELGKISKFQNKKFDVIKIEVKGSNLLSMNKKLKELDHTCEYSNYIPHCTLAYVKKNSCDHLIGDKYFLGKKILLKNLIFSSPKNGKFKLKSFIYGVG